MITKRNAKHIWKPGRMTFAAFLVALVILGGATVASAQHGRRVTKRVAFKNGEISTTLKGSIPDEMEVHEYVFRGRAGQTAKIDLSSMTEDITFYITDDEGSYLDEGSELRNWSGELPADGDYHVWVSSSSNRPRSYTLDIQIAADI
jgi:hypothetical protein